MLFLEPPAQVLPCRLYCIRTAGFVSLVHIGGHKSEPAKRLAAAAARGCGRRLETCHKGLRMASKLLHGEKLDGSRDTPQHASESASSEKPVPPVGSAGHVEIRRMELWPSLRHRWVPQSE